MMEGSLHTNTYESHICSMIREDMRRMFTTRLISGIILVIIALVTIITGGPLLLATLLFVSLVGMHELYGAMGIVRPNPAQIQVEGREYKARDKNRGKAPEEAMNILAAMGFAGAVAYYGLLFFMPEQYYLVGIVMTLILILAAYVFSYPEYHAEQVIATFFGMVYVAVMLGFIYVIRSSESGKILVWLVFLSSWGSDTCAYCVGVLIGRHKMAPVLSPKKSVEGAVGGVVGAGLLGLLYAFMGALISMVGDLAASAIKRDKGIKDYGKLIPGHGGVLDRFDSVIFTAPIIYFLSLVLI